MFEPLIPAGDGVWARAFLFFGLEIRVVDFGCFFSGNLPSGCGTGPLRVAPQCASPQCTQFVCRDWACLVLHTNSEMCDLHFERATTLCTATAVCDTCNLFLQVPEDAAACSKTGWKPFH